MEKKYNIKEILISSSPGKGTQYSVLFVAPVALLVDEDDLFNTDEIKRCLADALVELSDIEINSIVNNVVNHINQIYFGGNMKTL